MTTTAIVDTQEKVAAQAKITHFTLSIALSALSGVMFLLAFPPYGIWLLAWFAFVPEEIIKGGWWSIGVGLIFLDLNAARYFSGLRMSGFTIFLGILSVIGGVLNLVGMEGVNSAVLIIVLGGYLILKPYLDKRQLFGMAEQG